MLTTTQKGELTFDLLEKRLEEGFQFVVVRNEKSESVLLNATEGIGRVETSLVEDVVQTVIWSYTI